MSETIGIRAIIGLKMAEQLNLNVIVPTRGEMKILNVLWDLGQATVEEVIKHPSFSTPPNYKTTQTLLRIMEDKGLARHTTRGRVFVFAPCVTREQVTRLSVQNLLEQTFAGSLTEMMVGVIETGTVKESELEELEALIRNYRTQRANSPK
ncbi:MAG TPA: BlaI/MecI/CopY family transcriptional regulator [Candidatus Angelobacter sp.]|nr:BlaI/MecI/CopY family transcriptional regulator [Candidatus Angelobacter sp.]